MTLQNVIAECDLEKLPGYLMLAKLEKKVLRPGGIELTRQMLAELNIQHSDRVIEFAPGTGVTAALALKNNPSSYIALEKEQRLTDDLNRRLLKDNPYGRCIHGDAALGLDLPDNSATVIYGESMLTIHSPKTKLKMLKEIARLLEKGGRYAMQEITVVPDDIEENYAKTMLGDIIKVVRHPAWPNTKQQWREMMAEAGFEVLKEYSRPVKLLEPERLLEDEGADQAFKFSWNVLESDQAINRIREIRRVFQKYQDNLCGFCMICRKK